MKEVYLLKLGNSKGNDRKNGKQNDSTLKIANKKTSSIQTIWKKDDMIDIEREKCIIMKEIEEEKQKDNLIDLVNNRQRK